MEELGWHYIADDLTDTWIEDLGEFIFLVCEDLARKWARFNELFPMVFDDD